MIWSVVPARASASDARKFSFWPTPTTSGEPWRAPTTRAVHRGRTRRWHRRHAGGARPAARPRTGRRRTVVDQVGDDLGVGLAFEDVAGGLQLGAQFVVVLDDAVVDQRDARLVVPRCEMRVGVVRGRHAVGGPAGMGDAGEAGHMVLGDLVAQFGHALRAARAAQVAVGVDRDAAGVVAAVFQPLQAFNEDRGDVALGDGANNAAHRRNSCKGSGTERIVRATKKFDFFM